VRLGTRGSPLALAQAELVRRAYLDRFPEDTVEVVTIKTQGDRELDRPLDSFPGSGVFVKEIEAALLDDRVDAAVHCAKDLAIEDADGLELTAFLERADAHDVLIHRRPRDWEKPGPGFRIATDSTRRRVQLSDAWPGVEFVDIRGNVETRLAKLEAGEAEALVLAAAGLRRLDLAPAGEEPIATALCVPAPGQGAIVVQVRESDDATKDLRWLNHIGTALAVTAERDMAAALGAGCSVPLGVHVEFRAGETRLLAAFHDGHALFRTETRASANAAVEAVQLAIADLRDRGAVWGAGR
jgi:hydroxymethylbilane synthase